MKVKIVKNKVAPPFKTAEFDIMYNEGISLAGDLLDAGVKFEVVKKSGNSLSYGDIKLGAGRESAKAFLREDKKTAEKIFKEIAAKAKIVA